MNFFPAVFSLRPGPAWPLEQSGETADPPKAAVLSDDELVARLDRW
jgi:hypothetical protein